MATTKTTVTKEGAPKQPNGKVSFLSNFYHLAEKRATLLLHFLFPLFLFGSLSLPPLRLSLLLALLLDPLPCTHLSLCMSHSAVSEILPRKCLPLNMSQSRIQSPLCSERHWCQDGWKVPGDGPLCCGGLCLAWLPFPIRNYGGLSACLPPSNQPSPKNI